VKWNGRSKGEKHGVRSTKTVKLNPFLRGSSAKKPYGEIVVVENSQFDASTAVGGDKFAAKLQDVFELEPSTLYSTNKKARWELKAEIVEMNKTDPTIALIVDPAVDTRNKYFAYSGDQSSKLVRRVCQNPINDVGASMVTVQTRKGRVQRVDKSRCRSSFKTKVHENRAPLDNGPDGKKYVHVHGNDEHGVKSIHTVREVIRIADNHNIKASYLWDGCSCSRCKGSWSAHNSRKQKKLFRTFQPNRVGMFDAVF